MAFTESFPGYNLEKDLEYLYQDSVDSVAVKKLVTCGLEIACEELLQEQQVQQLAIVPKQEPQLPAKESSFTDLSQVESPSEPCGQLPLVLSKSENSPGLSQVDTEPEEKSDFSAKSEGMEEDPTNHNVKEELEVIGTPLTSNVDYLSQVLENDVEKSQFNSDTTVVETNQVDSCMALKDTTMDDLSQVTRLDTITPHTTTPSEKEDKEDKPKHRRKKERRKKRLLKFHEKLVKTVAFLLAGRWRGRCSLERTLQVTLLTCMFPINVSFVD